MNIKKVITGEIIVAAASALVLDYVEVVDA